MARNYAAVPHEYLQEMEDLNDAEFGRLMRALLLYSSTGEKMALSGNERFLFKRVIMQEERFQSNYDDSANRRSDSAMKAARARWDKEKSAQSAMQTDAHGCERIRRHANAYEGMPCDTNAQSAMQTDAEDANTNTKTNTETNGSTSTIAERQNFGGGTSSQPDPAFAEVRSFYMDRINPMPGSSTLAELDGFTKKLGSRLVIHAIEIAMGERKTAWSYIRGILRNWQRDGITCIEDLRRREAGASPADGKYGSRRPAGRQDTRSAEYDELMRIARGE